MALPASFYGLDLDSTSGAAELRYRFPFLGRFLTR